jgi:hypothetical protein
MRNTQGQLHQLKVIVSIKLLQYTFPHINFKPFTNQILLTSKTDPSRMEGLDERIWSLVAFDLVGQDIGI